VKTWIDCAAVNNMRAARIVIFVVLPLVLVMINVRLVMSPLWLQIEYTRPGFPVDPFGFTTEDRLEYGRYTVDYLIYRHDIAYLGNLRSAEGRPLFNERELIHMRDVHVLTSWAFVVAFIAGAAAIVCATRLVRQKQTGEFRRGLRQGAILTIALLVGIILIAVVGWEFFFTGFHQLFFADGTWYFLTSDTLIRLFPEQFWFDSALLIGVLTVFESLAILGITRALKTGE
jgi:integral membrane protein (TIGR01906 family)